MIIPSPVLLMLLKYKGNFRFRASVFGSELQSAWFLPHVKFNVCFKFVVGNSCPMF